MRAAVIVAAFMAAVPAMAQFDPFCIAACTDLINRCCGHDNGACDTLSSCGANRHSDACTNWGNACSDYCASFVTKTCLNMP
ncbi:hypothetical protein ESCO_002303 [Escovopsis weberi]|uniref:Uncharacterized protein n=1 Tax=Escovopsis weberi TaxID=150374 RepID=A0A0M8N862_ESCWE|nr:hypothetical protein ESCO_002303 [Escovopsis weberi]